MAWQNSRNYIYELINAQAVKLQMARRYLEAKDHNPAKISIDELTIGSRWVEEHLQQQNVLIRREVRADERSSEEYSKRTRFAYSANQISAYANGEQFRAVLAQIRRGSLLDRFNMLSKTERDQLLAALSKN